MKKTFLEIIFIGFIVSSGHGQESGIQFVRNLTWTQIITKAKAENKYIFMDCYATWCAPCKFMDKKIFTLGEVGTFFNSHFINVKIQMDETKADLELIRQWYTEAKRIEKEYSVSSFPTYLFFSPEGQPVHRVLGSFEEGKEFIEKANDALNPDTQYYTLINDFENHKRDSTFILKALTATIAAQDDSNTAKLGNYYLGSIKDTFSKENLLVIRRTIYTSQDDGFKLLLHFPTRVNDAMGGDVAEALIRAIAFQEEIVPSFENGAPPADWNKISAVLKSKYPLYADRIISESKPKYYRSKKMWPQYENSILQYMKSYGNQLGNFETNNISWGVFLNSNNSKVLAEALKWSKRTIADYPNIDPPNLDTYANLLYKTGDKQNAIAWEKKAIDLATTQKIFSNKKEFEQTLEKMKRGEKTWARD